MKILVASDIHGNSDKFSKVISFFKDENLDKIIILGDIFNYYQTTSDLEISKMLFSVAPKLEIVRGNCDKDEDEQMMPMGFKTYHIEEINNHKIMFFHGDKYITNDAVCVIFCSGHTHVAKIIKNENKIMINPGSVSRPRDGSIGSFLVIGDKVITIFDLNYRIINESFY